ncbi:hypothetical protein M758_5G148500 [Ceratodon purpureus]|nr:hypothetical protein M758_5G148500 [Ceratodon purpureus]
MKNTHHRYATAAFTHQVGLKLTSRICHACTLTPVIPTCPITGCSTKEDNKDAHKLVNPPNHQPGCVTEDYNLQTATAKKAQRSEVNASSRGHLKP